MAEQKSVRSIRHRAPFIKWLKAQPTNTVFGFDADNCALARYSGHIVGYVTYADGKVLPKWANLFVTEFCGEGGALTVGRALRIMGNLK